MGAKLRSWWQKIKQYRVTILVIAFILVVTIALIIVGYRFDWTGFNGNNKSGKTLWDWLNLLSVLAIPAVVGFGAVWFTTQQGKVADAENKDNQRETALQAYIDKMSELLLHEKLRDSAEDDEVRKIARVRTLTILPRLDGSRKGSVIRFLYESGLIDKDKTIIDLFGADLTWSDPGTFLNGANLSNAFLTNAILTLSELKNAKMNNVILTGAYLDFANLSDADLHYSRLNKSNMFNAKFVGANLSYVLLTDSILEEANLSKSNLTGAIFKGANLNMANLSEAIVDVEQLEAQAKSLKGATMPDGSIHP